MNYEPFNELATEALKYMNPEQDWRFIHGDAYTFYQLQPGNQYKSSFPKWKELQTQLFDEIRQNVNKPSALITNFTLVYCNKYTVCHPFPTNSGVITLKSAGAYAAIRKDDEDKSRKTAYRAMFLHAPELMRWKDSDSFGFYVAEQEKPVYPGERVMNYYPQAGTLLFYYHIDETYERSS